MVYFQQCLVVTISQQATAYYKPDCGTISSIEDVLLVVFGGQTTIYSIGDVLLVVFGGQTTIYSIGDVLFVESGG